MTFSTVPGRNPNVSSLPVIFGVSGTAVVTNIGVMAIAADGWRSGASLLLNGISGSDIRMLIAGADICLPAILGLAVASFRKSYLPPGGT